MAFVTADNLPWLVSAGLNFFYFVVFLFHDFLNIHLETKYEPSGFCITNYDPDYKQQQPPSLYPCAVAPNSIFADVGKLVSLVTHTSEAPDTWASGGQNNSHYWAFSVDFCFTILVLGIGFFWKKNSNQGFKSACIYAGVIMLHGILHWWLGYYKNCVLITETKGKAFGILFYAVFIFILIIVGFNRATNLKSLTFKVILSTLFTLLIVWTSTTKDSIGPIFGGTQLLLSIVCAFFPKKGVVSRKEGYFFIVPCIISLIELLYCTESGKPTPFNRLGGHFWYDFTLHTTFVVFQLKKPPVPAMKQD